MNINKSKKGFTLIELLIVIGIIAILAAIIVVAINPGRQFAQARNATRWSQTNTFVNAVYSYAIGAGGAFPACITAITVWDGVGTAPAGYEVSTSACEATGNLVPTHLSAIPEDPLAAGAATCGTGVGTDTGFRITRPTEHTIRVAAICAELDASIVVGQ